METLNLKTLEIKHPEYELYIPLYLEIEDLTEGGMVLQKNLNQYLVPKPGEDKSTYKYRKQIFSYEPVLAQCFSEFINLFMTSTYRVENIEENMDFWENFRQNTNGSGRDEFDLIREAILNLLKYRKLFGLIDYEKEKPKIVLIDPKDVIHYEMKGNNLKWIKYRQIVPKYKPIGETEWYCTWTVIDKENVYVYEAEIEEPQVDPEKGYCVVLKGKKSKDLFKNEQDSIKLVRSFKHNQPDIPVIYAEIPRDLWTSNLSIHMVREHLRIHNNLTYAANIAGVIQRLYKPMAETADRYVDPGEIVSNVRNANETILIGEDFRYIEAGGSSIVSLAGYLEDISAKIKSIIFSNGVTPGRKAPTQESGRAREMDFINQETALRSLGRIVQPWLEKLYRQIDDIMFDRDGKKIYVKGMEDFSLDAPDIKLSRLLQITQLPIPVPNLAFEKLMLDFIKTLLPGLDYKSEQEIKERLAVEYKEDDVPSLDPVLLLQLFEMGLIPPDKVLQYIGFRGKEFRKLKGNLKELLQQKLTNLITEKLINNQPSLKKQGNMTDIPSEEEEDEND